MSNTGNNSIFTEEYVNHFGCFVLNPAGTASEELVLDTLDKALQVMDEKHRRISIIAMSADVFQEELQQASQAGMDGFVSKPIDPGRLRQALLQAIGEK